MGTMPDESQNDAIVPLGIVASIWPCVLIYELGLGLGYGWWAWLGGTWDSFLLLLR